MTLLRSISLLPLLVVGTVTPLAAQDASTRVAAITLDPAEPPVAVGERTPITIVARDASGAVVEGIDFRVFTQGGLDYEDGVLVGTRGGSANLIISVVTPAGFEGIPAQLRVPLSVRWPKVTRVEVSAVEPVALYVGTSVRHSAAAYHADGSERPDPAVSWTSTNPSVATVSPFGDLLAHAPGRVTIHADTEGTRGSLTWEVKDLPATTIEITGGAETARQGDVLTFDARLTGPSGPVTDAGVLWTTSFVPDDSIRAPGASGIIEGGKFVGETPGVYTVVASAGNLAARKSVDVRPREAVREVEILGQGSVADVHTSDLWVFEGMDGRDYAVTGTWGGDGWAKFWDVTDPASIEFVTEIQVDARTVNDVKVSPDGRYAALSREGASNRRNGVVILDLADPRNPRIASNYDDGLTGGVHNMFAQNDYLFALSAGDKYVILDVTDIYNPRFVSEYNHPDSRIHDVWVFDGIAYSSEWGNGVVVVDVGNGRWGGSIDNPVFVTNVPYPVGATHAAFPYYQEDTGKVYLFLGDEIMARGGAAWAGTGLARIPQEGGTPSVTDGYIHIIDFTDPENPKDVARYHVSEFGTHNLWVEDDVLYVAYYEGGVRAVDVSGELLGNLATQGREIAVFKAYDPDGFVANAPMAWGPQMHKGNLFFTDFNSGLWSIRIQPRSRPAM